MQNELHLNLNKKILQQLNQMYLTDNNNVDEKSKQYFVLNERLLKDKEKAEERDRNKTAFLANIVHDICSPMNAIKGFAELLKTPDLAKEDTEKYAQIISQCSDNLLDLVHDLLDISKIEAGQLSIIKEPGNLKDLFNELFELFDNPMLTYRSNEVQLKSYMRLNREQCLVEIDFLRLRQVLTNLISNALKFTEKGHVIFGCCLIDPKTLCFSVEDTGIGINPENKANIFNRFWQINDPNSKNIIKGSGLGLSIVKSLVELMNGEVWVESTQGVGSTFYFTLPYKKSDQNQSIIEKSISCNWNNKNVLVVEDDDFDACLIGNCLEELKANCFFVKEDRSVLDYLKSNLSIDLILFDMQSPDFNGFELVQNIKKTSPNIPIVILTASNNQKDKDIALYSGCNGHISKPFNKKDLIRLMHEQFKIRRNDSIN